MSEHKIGKKFVLVTNNDDGISDHWSINSIEDIEFAINLSIESGKRRGSRNAYKLESIHLLPEVQVGCETDEEISERVIKRDLENGRVKWGKDE